MTYYRCDRCKKEIIDDERTVVVIEEPRGTTEVYLRNRPRNIDLCPDCLKMLNNFLQKKIVNYNDICGGNENE